MMQRFINDPNDMVDETLQGFVAAHKDLVRLSDINPRVLCAKTSNEPDRVGIVSGGGSGHEPAFIGYAGQGMLDAVAVGELFSSPTANSFFHAIQEADNGAGVVVLYGNYAGDNMNVKMAMKMAEKAGIEVRKVVANDDVCSASFNDRSSRRGVAGEIFMWKASAAKAAQGGSLQDVQIAAQKAIDNCRSIGVGLGPCTLPAVGHPNFQIEPGNMEVGIGHHGEPGVQVKALGPANEVAREMVRIVTQDPGQPENAEYAILLSGLGATPINELYILNAEITRALQHTGHRVFKTFVGNYFTSLEMVGASLTIMALDDELKTLLAHPVQCPGMRHG